MGEMLQIVTGLTMEGNLYEGVKGSSLRFGSLRVRQVLRTHLEVLLGNYQHSKAQNRLFIALALTVSANCLFIY